MTVGIIGLTATAAMAASTPPNPGRVGPNQAFIGLVNGKSGRVGHAQIRVACPGPIKPGETTHPLAHQPLEVVRPEAINTTTGFTGPNATQISAFVGIPPAASEGAGIATFVRYGVTKPIPTTLTVPCSGSGFITFIPFPRDPGVSRAFVVPVDYVNIAV
jgi:hypothetical protein